MEYAIIALLYLDTQAERTASVRQISADCGVPEALLSKVMQSMKSRRIVEAVYGNHGGYRLKAGLAEISLLDLSRMLLGPVHVAACLEPGNRDCPVQAQCTIITPMTVLNQKLVELFESTSLQTLAERKATA